MVHSWLRDGRSVRRPVDGLDAPITADSPGNSVHGVPGRLQRHHRSPTGRGGRRRGRFARSTHRPARHRPARPVRSSGPNGCSARPDGTNAWRVLYHSTDVTGADIIVSGVVIAPDDDAPAGSRTVVGWGHPTTGAAAKCAPSNGIDPFDLVEGMRALLAAGYVVSYADYPGLGVEGPNSYMIGTSEGNSVLDAVRAARNIPETAAGSDVLLWGHSQGGQAVLFAGQDAKTYAPELQVRGGRRRRARGRSRHPVQRRHCGRLGRHARVRTPSTPSSPCTPRSIPACRSPRS